MPFDRDTQPGADLGVQRIVDWLVGEFERESGIDVSRDKLALQRITEAATKAWTTRTTTPNAAIELPFLAANRSGPKHLSVHLPRAKLESIAAGG